MKRIATRIAMIAAITLWGAWAYLMVGAPYFPAEWLTPITEIH